MNLNTFARHGVFESRGLTKRDRGRLRDPRSDREARVLPYQLHGGLSWRREACRDRCATRCRTRMEIALANVPAIEGKVYVCPDVSGSMSSPVTGYRKGATTQGALHRRGRAGRGGAAAQEPDAEVLPFEQRRRAARLNGATRVMTNAQKLAAIGGGGTNCSAPLAWLNAPAGARRPGRLRVGQRVVGRRGARTARRRRCASGSGSRQRNPDAKLVCIDLQPNRTTQAHETRRS